MKVLFSGQIPKDLKFPDDNEDAIETVPEKNTIAISDGASESFDSKTWAHLIVSTLGLSPELSQDWLDSQIVEYAKRFDYDLLSWSKQAAFSRGSFATLLLIKQIQHDSIEVISIGDTLAVLLDGGEFVESYPYTRAAEFQQHPELLSTKPGLNEFIRLAEFFPSHTKNWWIQERRTPILLCMTDALGEWAFRNEEEGNPIWQVLCKIETLEEFQDLVERERSDNRMRFDDTTLLRVSFDDWGNDELSNT